MLVERIDKKLKCGVGRVTGFAPNGNPRVRLNNGQNTSWRIADIRVIEGGADSLPAKPAPKPVYQIAAKVDPPAPAETGSIFPAEVCTVPGLLRLPFGSDDFVLNAEQTLLAIYVGKRRFAFDKAMRFGPGMYAVDISTHGSRLEVGALEGAFDSIAWATRRR